MSTREKAEKPGECIFSDQSMTRAPKGCDIGSTNKNWYLLVDQVMEYKESRFHETKGDLVEPTCKLFHKWKQPRKPAVKLWKDDAGENKKLEKRLNSAEWKLGVEVKYTVKATLQWNYLVKIGFTKLAKKERAMMTKAHSQQDMRLRLCKKAFICTTLLDNQPTMTINEKTTTRYEHFHNKKLAFV